MTYFLDTNICIYFLNGKFLQIKEKMKSIPQNDIKIPVVVLAELYYGAIKSEKREYNIMRFSGFTSMYNIIPFDDKAARLYGDIRVELETKGKIIGGNDLMIATSALSHNAVLVTKNTGEFSRINKLLVEDWTI